ncbi:MAG: DUF3368 domain-containing protein [Bacteroidales bacterium]|nr:DUF3368 domain-containing protein [Bacteroidales bacterium]
MQSSWIDMQGKVICNTGPLIALSIIDRLDILRHLFDVIAIPEAVHREILEGGVENAGLSNYHKVQWIEVMPLPLHTDPLLITTLDAGEADVIALSRELNADLVLIDERKARKVARNIYGLRVIGTVGILVKAKKYGLVGNVASLLQIMRDSGYRIGDSIVEAALRQAGEL